VVSGRQPHAHTALGAALPQDRVWRPGSPGPLRPLRRTSTHGSTSARTPKMTAPNHTPEWASGSSCGDSGWVKIHTPRPTRTMPPTVESATNRARRRSAGLRATAQMLWVADALDEPLAGRGHRGLFVAPRWHGGSVDSICLGPMAM